MPRIKRTASEEFSDIIKSQIKRQGVGTYENLGKRVGTCKATTAKKINEPDSLTVDELKRYVKALKIPPEDVLAFIYEKTPTEVEAISKKTHTFLF